MPPPTSEPLQGQNQLPKVVKGVKFRDGIEVAPEAKFAA
jgi:hypothetical protein